MDLSKHITPNQILTGISPQDKWELIDTMLTALHAHPVCKRQRDEVRERISSTVIDREKTMSTGLGHGLAFPHGRVADFHGFAVCIATLAAPIEYGTPDKKPVSIACMVVTSENNPTIALRVMGVLSRLLSDEKTRSFFLSATDSEKVYNFIIEKKIDLDVSVTARDIMRPRIASVNPETPLREVTYIMMKNKLEAVPVTDNDGRVVGEITCDILFQEGIPDFFTQLKSVSFIRHFDPFEKYFDVEAHSTAAKVMSTSFALVEKDATMMEIVFLLSVKNHAKLYVAEDGVLQGVVDRIDVLDRILNL